MSLSFSDPKEKTSLESLHFTVDSSLIKRLGTESVSDKILSLVEVIKNSYDADATQVDIRLLNMRTGDSSIEIMDNG